MEQQALCVDIFKGVYEEYKQMTKMQTDAQSLTEKCTPDYVNFQKIIKYFNILDGILKYVVLLDDEYYLRVSKQFDNLMASSINMPRTTEELFSLYSTYPRAIEKLHEELYELINLEHYEGLLIMRKISPLLYYSTINTDIANKISMFENDTKHVGLILDRMIKNLLRDYVKMFIEVEKNKVKSKHDKQRTECESSE